MTWNWQLGYNEERPHDALGDLPPADWAMATADPLGFLGRFPDGAILDEAD